MRRIKKCHLIFTPIGRKPKDRKEAERKMKDINWALTLFSRSIVHSECKYLFTERAVAGGLPARCPCYAGRSSWRMIPTYRQQEWDMFNRSACYGRRSDPTRIYPNCSGRPAALAWGPPDPGNAFAAATDKPALLGGTPVHKSGWPQWPEWREAWEPGNRQQRSGRWSSAGGGGAADRDRLRQTAALIAAWPCPAALPRAGHRDVSPRLMPATR